MSSIAADSPGHSTASAHPFVPLRREDVRLLTGRGLFTADVRPEGAAHVAFVRSMHANGRLVSVDASAALAMPGVIAVLTARELGAHGVQLVHPLLVQLGRVKGLHLCRALPQARISHPQD